MNFLTPLLGIALFSEAFTGVVKIPQNGTTVQDDDGATVGLEWEHKLVSLEKGGRNVGDYDGHGDHGGYTDNEYSGNFGDQDSSIEEGKKVNKRLLSVGVYGGIFGGLFGVGGGNRGIGSLGEAKNVENAGCRGGCGGGYGGGYGGGCGGGYGGGNGGTYGGGGGGGGNSGCGGNRDLVGGNSGGGVGSGVGNSKNVAGFGGLLGLGSFTNFGMGGSITAGAGIGGSLGFGRFSARSENGSSFEGDPITVENDAKDGNHGNYDETLMKKNFV